MRPLALAALSAALVSCGTAPEPGRSSSTLVVRGDTVFLTSPDDRAVVALDASTLEERWRTDVDGTPEQLAVVGNALVVSLRDRAEVVWLSLETRRSELVSTPCGGTGAVVAEGDGALVACPNDDRVLRVIPSGVDWEEPMAGRPTALAVQGDRFGVGLSRTGRAIVLSLADRSRVEDRALVDTSGFAAVSVEGVAFDAGGALVASFVRVDRDSDRDRPADRGGYGAVVDDNPRIEPRLSAPFGSRYARYDGGARVFGGPSAIAIANGMVWVALRSTDDVVALESGESHGLIRRRATFRTGRGPRGLAVSEDGRTAWVDVGFGRAVARLTLTPSMQGPEGPVVEATLERTRESGPTSLTEAALRGRALFDDADETHLTPSGVVTCATCHPGGGEDGLSWFFHTPGIAPKLRRTPPAWGAREGMAPFHWDGEFDDAAALTQTTIRELMEGDGLLVDLDAMAAWMAESPIPMGRPVRDAEDAAAVEAGRRVFDASGCGACHAGPLFTDELMHPVDTPSDDPDARLGAVSTPSLRGVRARPPFLHDGRAPTLDALFLEHRHGLDDPSVDAVRPLVAYLETL